MTSGLSEMNNPFGPIQLVGMFVVGVVLLICYGILPYVGAGILMSVDYAAFGFRWLGIGNPVVSCAILGGVIGALICLQLALRRQGITGQLRKIAVFGAGFMVSLYVLSLLFCHIMPPTYQPGPAAVALPGANMRR